MISATVGHEDLEHQLEVVRALAPGEMGGVFGPDTLTWRIDREALTFLGAGRALLLQPSSPVGRSGHRSTLMDPRRPDRSFSSDLRGGPHDGVRQGTAKDIECATRRWHADQSCR